MRIREQYTKWSVSTQLISTFIFSSLILVGILIIITIFQLDWLRSTMISNTRTVIHHNIRKHLSNLGWDEANFTSLSFNSFINYINYQKNLDELMLGFGSTSPPIISDDPIWDDSIPDNITETINGTAYTYESGVFFSKYKDSLSSEGETLVDLEAAMDKFYPLIFREYFTLIYSGFEIDEILHYYPGYKSPDRTYSPLVNEWYYKAKENPERVIITEPYQEDGTWMITISQAILDSSNNFYGVTAADITLSNIMTRLNNVVILENGFILLITAGEGFVLSRPHNWLTLGDELKINDEDKTGISLDKWYELTNETYGDLVEFTGPNSTDFYATLHPVRPYNDIKNITHWIMVCAVKDEVDEPVDDMHSDFSDTYKEIFWIVISIAIATFLLISILLLFAAEKVATPLRLLNSIILKISSRSLYPKILKGTSLAGLSNYTEYMEGLINAFIKKIKRIDEKEKKYDKFVWGTTRPNDHFLFNEWKDKLYPFNIYKDKEMSWRSTIPSLVKVSIMSKI